MPKDQPKKITKKKTKTHVTHRRVPKSVKKDITNAVNSLPGLLIDHHTNLNQAEPTYNESHDLQYKTPVDNTPPQKSMLPPAPYQPPQHSGLLLLVGVVLLMATIIGMWAWNMKSMINNVFAAPSAEIKIIANVGEDFSDIIDYIEKQDSIGAKLNELTATAALTTSSSTTTTVDLKAVLSVILKTNTTTTSTP